MRLIDIEPILDAAKLAGKEYVSIDFLKGFEQVDVVPVVRGEWIAEQKGAEYCEFRCSACDGSIGQTDQFDETEVKQFSEWYKYRPNCGAKMEDK